MAITYDLMAVRKMMCCKLTRTWFFILFFIYTIHQIGELSACQLSNKEGSSILSDAPQPSMASMDHWFLQFYRFVVHPIVTFEKREPLHSSQIGPCTVLAQLKIAFPLNLTSPDSMYLSYSPCKRVWNFTMEPTCQRWKPSNYTPLLSVNVLDINVINSYTVHVHYWSYA